MNTPAPDIEISRIILPKSGSTMEEYEDASAFSNVSERPFRAAVADGATESAYSGPWAQILVRFFVEHGELSLQECRKLWQNETTPIDESAPWYHAQKREAGAHATFLGLEIRGDATWKAIAVGDCNLMYLRGGQVVNSWPFHQPGQFSNIPNLLVSVASNNDPEWQRQHGNIERDDQLLLATDAVAAWLLQTEHLPEELSHEAFREARAHGLLKNDDSTLLRIRIQS